MRHLGFTALLAPLALLAFACEEDPAFSPSGFQLPDGGAGFEIPDSSTTKPDAPPPSGVTVTVVRQGAPQKDVRVIFHDAAGAVTGDFKTDAAGVLSQPAAPSMLTVLAPGIQTDLAPLTYLGVADGDTFTIELEHGNDSSMLGEYSVTLAGGFDNAQEYSVNASRYCNSVASTAADGPFRIEVYPECVGAKGIVLASASQDGQPLGFSFVKNLAKPVGGSTITVPALPAFVAAGSLTLTPVNVPQDAYSWGSVAVLADGLRFNVGSPSGFGESPVTFPVPVGFADAHQAQMSTYSNSSTSAIVKREPTTVSNITLDYATLLPSLGETNVVVDDLKRPKVTWSPSASLNGTDGGIVRIGWYGGNASLRWRFVVPPGTTEVTAPALPGDLSIPPATEADVGLAELAFVEATFLADYKAFKSLPMPTDENLSLLSTGTTLPVNGTLRTVRFGE